MLNSYTDFRIHNLKPLSFNRFYALIPDNYDDEIYKDIKSVFAKNFLGLKSVDYTKENYSSFNKNHKNDSYFNFINEMTNKIWEILDDMINDFMNLGLKEQNHITLGILATLVRLQNSYESSIFLIKNQFYFESISICRMIFEQVNYCYNLAQTSEEDFKKLSKSNIRKRLKSTNISKLIKLLPDFNLGSFYSYLSELSHIDINQTSKYLVFDKINEEYNVTLKSIKEPIEASFILFKILDLNCIIFEYILNNYADFELKFIKKTATSLSPSKNRITKKLVNEFNNKFEELEKTIESTKHIRKSYKRDIDDDLPF